MENLEIRILFTEDTFTNLCKNGFIKHQSPTQGRLDIHFYKQDLLSLVKGEIVTKEIDTNEVMKFKLQTLDVEQLREIVKRSPVYYELSNQF